jgi:hypothetical protein
MPKPAPHLKKAMTGMIERVETLISVIIPTYNYAPAPATRSGLGTVAAERGRGIDCGR